MADISQIKLPNNTTYDLKDSKKTGIYYVKGTQTATTGAWTGNIDIPALYTGLTIMYYLPYDGSGNATLNLTLSDGTTTGAKNCYITTGRLTTHYGAGRNIIMTFYKAGDISIKGAATTDDRWICDAYYDTNDGAYYLRRTQTNILAGPNKIFPYTIIMQVADGRWESIVTSSSTGTSKARNTHGFRLGQILFMYANATYNENVRVANNNIWDQHSAANDHRYSFNTANNATSGTTANKPIYIVGALNATDGLFYLDATWWTQTLPSTDDGKLYIYIGDAYDYYRFDYVNNHPIYWFKNGAIRLFTQDAATVTGHIVAKDVPSDAVFTDTKVTSSTNHYTPATASGQDKTASASGATAAWSIDVVKGVTLNTDGKGHVTGLSVTSGKIPANPNSDTKVRQTLSTTNKNYPLLMSYAESSNTTANIDNVSYRANAIYANPSTGNIQATKLNGVDIGSSPKFTDHTYSGTGLISVNSSGVISTTAEANQNAFSNVKVGSTTVAADTKTDTLELVGSNVTLTPDATNDKVTIGITKANVTTALGYTPPTADTNVTQTADDSTASAFEVLFSNTADNTTRTEAARKSSKLKFQPSSGNLSVTSINNISFAFITGAVGQTGDTYISITGTGFNSVNSIIPLALPADGKPVSISEYTVTDAKITFVFSSPLTSVTNIKALLIYIH